MVDCLVVQKAVLRAESLVDLSVDFSVDLSVDLWAALMDMQWVVCLVVCLAGCWVASMAFLKVEHSVGWMVDVSAG